MKHNWEYKRIADVAPLNPFKGNVSLADGRVWCLNLDKIQSGTGAVLSYDYITESEIGASTSKFCEDNVLFSKLRPNLNKVVVPTKKGFCTTELVPLYPKHEVNKYYLAYYLRNPRFVSYLVDKTGGAKMPRVKMDIFWETQIPVPTLVEQQRIVAELDTLNGTISKCRELLATLDTLAQSLFYDIFGDPVTNPKGWEISTFGNIGSFTRGGGFLKRDFEETGVPCIHYGQIHAKFKSNLVKDNLTFISEATSLKSKFAKQNDVIIAITSEDLDGSCKSIAWLGDFNVAVGAHAAIFSHTQNPIFIVYYMQTKLFALEKERYARGSKVLEIRPKDIENIPIYLPPLALQESFARKIEAIEAEKKKVEATLAEVQTLLDSRMDYWFN